MERLIEHLPNWLFFVSAVVQTVDQDGVGQHWLDRRFADEPFGGPMLPVSRVSHSTTGSVVIPAAGARVGVTRLDVGELAGKDLAAIRGGMKLANRAQVLAWRQASAAN